MNYTALIEKYNRLFEAESNMENVFNPLVIISRVDVLYIDKIRPRLLTCSFKFDSI
jgi:hypothetical protein